MTTKPKVDDEFVVEMVPLDQLKEHPRNYQTHPDEQVVHLEESLNAYGFYRNVVVARGDWLLAGHGVVKAARKRGAKLVPVRRLDLDHMDPAALKVLALDNEVEHLAEVDDRALSELLKEIKDSDVVGLLGTGYDERMLANLIYVTRPESEVRDLQRASEWVGMPEYDEGESPNKVSVNFASDADRKRFSELIGVPIGPHTTAVWWPARSKDDIASVEFLQADDGQSAAEPRAILDASPRAGLMLFLRECAAVGGIAVEQVRADAIAEVAYLNKATVEVPRLRQLEDRWYASLAGASGPDWSVYDSDEYLSELWACWMVYSRAYLREARKRDLFTGLGAVRRVVDLGCGFGYTTAALAEMFPDAEVVGTNLEGRQAVIARRLGERYGYRLVEAVSEVGGHADLVFASEYFEHIPKPVEHLAAEVVECLQPRSMLVANAFAARSIGHFPTYQVGGEQIAGKGTARKFGEAMTNAGYVRIKTGVWNERPAFWRRAGEVQ